MSEELERLRANLEAMERIAGLWVFSREFFNEYHEHKDKIREQIARLEAEAADPWRENYKAIEKWRKMDDGGLAWDPERKAVALVDHLTAENADLKQKYDLANDTIKTATERLNDTKGELTAAKIMIADRDDKIATLAARVAELEAKPSPIDPDGYQLGDFRVMKTAQEIAIYAMDRNMDHPVTVKTARRAIWAIKEFVEQARHWHGLSKLKPYRWTSLGRDDANFIDEDFDATESPCDYDPDAHKPLGDMQPPFEGPIVGLEPVLDPARVLATASGIMEKQGWVMTTKTREDLMGNVQPYRLKRGGQ